MGFCLSVMNREQQRHIVMLNKSYPPWLGGVEKHVGDISEALAQHGWQVTVLVCSDTSKHIDEVINGVRVIRIPRLGTLLSQPITWGYIKTLLSIQPDIVHCHVPFPLAWLAVNKLPNHVPVICTWHSDIIRQRFLMPILSFIEQRFLQRCDHIIVTSPEYLNSSVPLRDYHHKCKVIPLSLPLSQNIDLDEVNLIKIKYRKKISNKIVLSIGRLVGYKGLRVLIDAMKNNDADLIIAGDGNLKSSLRNQARKIGLKNRVHFIGSVTESEKHALLCLADVFVLPSYQRNEAFGYVLLEAMSNGCPVISTNIPTGVRWVNQHNYTGLVVEPNNSEAMAIAINEIIDHPIKKQEFSINAKKRIQSEFQFDDCITKLEDIYHCSLK